AIPLCPSARKATIRPSGCRLTETVTIRSSSCFDLFNAQAGIRLAVAHTPAIALLGLVLENQNLLMPAVLLHGGDHLGPFHGRGAHLGLPILGDQQHPIQLDGAVGLGLQPLHPDPVAFSHPVLLSARLHNRVHQRQPPWLTANVTPPILAPAPKPVKHRFLPLPPSPRAPWRRYERPW